MKLPGWPLRRARSSLVRVDSQRLDELCEFVPGKDAPQEELVFWFVRLVQWLRPAVGQRADLKLRYLEAQLTRHADWRAKVSHALSALIARSDVHELLAYAGIPRDFHFLGALTAWASSRALPVACGTRSIAQIFTLAFEEQDLAWLGQLEHHPSLIELVDHALYESLSQALSDASIDLAHQIVAQAHAPSVRSLSERERSPFRGLYEAVLALNRAPQDAAPRNAVSGRVAQCLAMLESHRKSLTERGADLNTTFQLVRLRQQLKRLLLLAQLRHDAHAQIGPALVELVDASLQDATGKRLVWGSSDLVLQNMVDTAASVGRDYLGTAQSSSLAAFRAGAWGGALMALATLVKFLLASLHLPQLYEGFVFSLNYAAVFCAAYLLHFTIATKLPAHTAAALARSVQGEGSHRERLARFLEVWRAMVRLQLVGLIGNVVVAAPLALALAFGFRQVAQHHLLGPEKAMHVLSEHSLFGPSILFAAITGGMLWVSSLTGAVVDNWTRVVGLSERLATNVVAMRTLHVVRARKRAEKIAGMTGGLAANVALGFMLGGLPALFAIAELPVSIRHVTVSASSVAMAWLTGAGSPRQLTLALFGVLAVAIVNVTVSFSLALWLALRSTRGLRRGGAAHALVRIGMRRSFRRRPRTAPLGLPSEARV